MKKIIKLAEELQQKYAQKTNQSLSEDDKSRLVNLLSQTQGLINGLYRAFGDATPSQAGADLWQKLRSPAVTISVAEAKQIAQAVLSALYAVRTVQNSASAIVSS